MPPAATDRRFCPNTRRGGVLAVLVHPHAELHDKPPEVRIPGAHRPDPSRVLNSTHTVYGYITGPPPTGSLPICTGSQIARSGLISK